MDQNKRMIVYMIFTSIFTVFILVGLDLALDIGILKQFGFSLRTIFSDQLQIVGFMVAGIFLLLDFLLVLWLARNKSNQHGM